MLSDPAPDLDARAVLDRAERVVVEQRAREVEELRLALTWADLHSEDPRVPEVPLLPGDDHLITLGGEGTPQVQELCWAELAIARRAGVVATQNLAADALDLAYRLPLTWEATGDLRLPGWVARKVAAMSRRLTKDQAGLVDVAVAAAVDESPRRILTIAEAKVIEADVAAHRARLAQEATKVGVRLSRRRPGDAVDEVEAEAGTRRVTLRLPNGTALDFDATVAEIADALQDHAGPEACELTRGELEAKAVELLTNPHAAAAFLDEVNDPSPPSTQDAPTLPASKTRRRPATIYLHLTDLVLSGTVPGVARVEGLGPMLLEQLTELLGQREITVQPVIDLRHTHSVNGYEHPTLVRHRTLLRMLGDVFPHSPTSGYRRLDHDHPTPYDPDGPPGQTGDHNDAPLTRSHHRAKTHCESDFGRLTWMPAGPEQCSLVPVLVSDSNDSLAA